MEKYLISNCIITPDGTRLKSRHSHDYVTHKDKNGEMYMIDGGNDYIRTSINKIPAISNQVYNTDSHEIIRNNFEWGSYGKSGKEQLKYILLKDMEKEHIQAILDTQTHIKPHIRKIFLDELEFRKTN